MYDYYYSNNYYYSRGFTMIVLFVRTGPCESGHLRVTGTLSGRASRRRAARARQPAGRAFDAPAPGLWSLEGLLSSHSH